MTTFDSSSAALADSAPSVGQQVRRGLKDSTPVLLGFVPVALVLGAQATAKGFHLLEVPMMAGGNFAGGSEFAAVGLWTSPPHLLLIAAMTLLINSRHLLMGAALVPLTRHLSARKILPALFLMCDESWAMALADARAKGVFSLPYYLGLSAALWTTWVISTSIGALAGPLIGDLAVYGLDMAFPATFFALLRGAWTGFKAARPWLVSLIAAALASLILPGTWYVVVGAVAGLIAAYLMADVE